MGNYEPTGTRFYDIESGREMILVGDDDPREEIRGWICYKHPDGQWVTLRKATANDLSRLAEAGLIAPKPCAVVGTTQGMKLAIEGMPNHRVAGVRVGGVWLVWVEVQRKKEHGGSYATNPVVVPEFGPGFASGGRIPPPADPDLVEVAEGDTL